MILFNLAVASFMLVVAIQLNRKGSLLHRKINADGFDGHGFDNSGHQINAAWACDWGAAVFALSAMWLMLG